MNLKIKNITPVIIAKDAQTTIKETLESLTIFSEVILYLNNSNDKTYEIAKTYTNVNVVEGEFIGFGPTKNIASEFSSNSWVLSLDSDEVIPKELLTELTQLQLSDNKEVFLLKRDNYFFDKKVKHSGWGDDYLIRIYNRLSHKFCDNLVHEFIELKADSKKTSLINSFKHNAVDNINQFLTKSIKYSDLASKDKSICSYALVIFKAIFTFVKIYFLKLGILDGWRGVFIASSASYSKFFRYTKMYLNCKNNAKG